MKIEEKIEEYITKRSTPITYVNQATNGEDLVLQIPFSIDLDQDGDPDTFVESKDMVWIKYISIKTSDSSDTIDEIIIDGGRIVLPPNVNKFDQTSELEIEDLFGLPAIPIRNNLTVKWTATNPTDTLTLSLVLLKTAKIF